MYLSLSIFPIFYLRYLKEVYGDMGQNSSSSNAQLSNSRAKKQVGFVYCFVDQPPKCSSKNLAKFRGTLGNHPSSLQKIFQIAKSFGSNFKTTG
jgi:hypothetical protein